MGPKMDPKIGSKIVLKSYVNRSQKRNKNDIEKKAKLNVSHLEKAALMQAPCVF